VVPERLFFGVRSVLMGKPQSTESQSQEQVWGSHQLTIKKESQLVYPNLPFWAPLPYCWSTVFRCSSLIKNWLLEK
jgi:hypothetical protein